MKKLNSGRLAVTYAGCFLGAGFVSGQEMHQYFGAFGIWGYVGFLLAAGLFFAFGVLLVRLTQLTGIQEMDEIVIPWNVPWLRHAVGGLEAVFLFGMVVLMTAGSGALVHQVTGLSTYAGSILFCVVVAVCAIAGLRGMVNAFSALVPVLVLATVAFAVAAVCIFGTEEFTVAPAAQTNPLMPNWVVAALTYVAYNLLGSVGIITPIGVLVKEKKTVWRGIGLGCGMLLAIAASILLPEALHPSAVAAELPMVALACDIDRTLGSVYGVLLLLGMFGNCLASLVALMTYLEQKQPRAAKIRKPLLAGIAVLAWAGSLLGFSEIIAVVFPIFGYLSIACLGCLVAHYRHCRKRLRREQTKTE